MTPFVLKETAVLGKAMNRSTKIFALAALLLTVNAPAAVAEQKGAGGEFLSWVSRLYGIRAGSSAAISPPKHTLKAAHQRNKVTPSLAPFQLPAGISFSLGSESAGQAQPSVNPLAATSPAEKASSRVATDTTARFGDYYAALAVDYDLPRAAAGIGQKNRKGSALDLAAGTKVKGLDAGIGYARRNDYQPALDQKAASGLPYHIFATGGKGENVYDQDGYALFFSVGYDLTEDLNMNGTLGYARVKNRTESEASLESQRWGLDIGASYRLLDNLYYDAHLGYVTLDGPPESSASAASSPTPAANDPAGGNFYHVINQLRMTF